jgi:hypothetical protein
MAGAIWVVTAAFTLGLSGSGVGGFVGAAGAFDSDRVFGRSGVVCVAPSTCAVLGALSGRVVRSVCVAASICADASFMEVEGCRDGKSK